MNAPIDRANPSAWPIVPGNRGTDEPSMSDRPVSEPLPAPAPTSPSGARRGLS